MLEPLDLNQTMLIVDNTAELPQTRLQRAIRRYVTKNGEKPTHLLMDRADFENAFGMFKVQVKFNGVTIMPSTPVVRDTIVMGRREVLYSSRRLC
jgi:hypothetical protein